MTRSISSLLRHSLARNALAVGLTQLSNFIPLLLVPLLTQRLGLDAFGVTAVALSLTQVALIITDFGYGLSATYKVSSHRDDRHYLNGLIGSILLGKVPLVLLACALVLLFPLLSATYAGHYPVFLMAIVCVVGQGYQLTWLFMGLERMKAVTLYMVGTKVAYAIAMVLFVHSADDAYLVILGWGVAQLLAALLSMLFAFRIGYRLRVPALAEVAQEFRQALPFFVSRVAVSTYTSAATTLVGLSGPAQAAQFYACQQVYKIGSALPVNQVLYPYMTKHRNWRVFGLVTLVSTLLLGGLSLALGLYADAFIRLAFGPEFGAARDTFIVFLAAMLVSYLAAAFGYPAFSAIGRLQGANSSVVYAACLNLTLLGALYACDALSALNTAISILVTELAVLCLRLVFLRRDLRATHDPEHAPAIPQHS